MNISFKRIIVKGVKAKSLAQGLSFKLINIDFLF